MLSGNFPGLESVLALVTKLEYLVEREREKERKMVLSRTFPREVPLFNVFYKDIRSPPCLPKHP
jgi:hypothetical protein